MKKALSMILSLTLAFSLLPATVLAEGADPAVDEVIMNETIDTEDVIVPEETEETESEEEIQDTDPDSGQEEIAEDKDSDEEIIVEEFTEIEGSNGLKGGTLGEKISWLYEEETGILIIAGTGEMPKLVSMPWNSFRSNVKKVGISGDITSICSTAFQDCKNIEEVIIPDTVTAIGDRVFSDCKKLNSIELPTGLKSLGMRAFENCKSLTKINIGSELTSIGKECFSYSGIETFSVSAENPAYVVIGGGLIDKSDGTLVRASNTSGDFVIKSGIHKIGDGAFSGCNKITSITIPNSITTIQSSAIKDCTELKSVSIGTGIESISASLFRGCNNLTSLTVSPYNTHIRSYEGVIYDRDKKTLLCYPTGRSGTFHVPVGVVEIGFNAFGFCEKLTCIDIPSTVTYIDDAFYGCSSLETVYCTNSLGESMEGYGFGSKPILTDIYFSGTEEQWGHISYNFYYDYGDYGYDDEDDIVATIHYGVNLRFESYRGQYRDYNKFVPYGEKYGELPTPTRSGYVFDGWYTAETGGSKVTSTTVATVGKADVLYDHWTVEEPVAITTQPTSKTVAEGATATFKVVASGTGLTYRWQYLTTKTGASWANCTSTSKGYNTASLQIVGTTGRNGYKYRCIVKDSAGKSVTSSAVKLTVTAAGPTITTQPASKTVTEGNTATFKVVATGTGLTYQWQYKTAKSGASWVNCSSVSKGYNTASLQIVGTTGRNGYSYRCIVNDSAGKSVTSSEAKLTVKASGPVITSQPASATVAKDTVVKFSVTATGDGLAYQWEYSVDGTTWKTSNASTATTESINVKASSTSNGRYYRCVVTDSAGKSVTSSAAKLTMK